MQLGIKGDILDVLGSFNFMKLFRHDLKADWTRNIYNILSLKSYFNSIHRNLAVNNKESKNVAL